MNTEKVAECVGRLTLLRFFPQNAHAVAELARIVNELCASDAEGTRLTDRLLREHDQWPGPLELRRCYWVHISDKGPCGRCQRYPGWTLDGSDTVPCACPAGRRERELMALGYSVSRPWIPPQWAMDNAPVETDLGLADLAERRRL
jgi:hypothetical protein